MKTTLMEALGYMCLLKDKEQADEEKEHAERYINFLSLVRSHPPQDKEASQRQKEYMDYLNSKLPQPPVPKYDWDFNVIDKYTAKQNAKIKERR